MSQVSIGIVGLPNVGKSTLFQALTAVSVPAENYPFCTIDPNVGVVEVPDPRLWELVELVPREKVVPNVVEFVDIAGLVRGASRGEGLGNRFLENIRRVDAIAHVVRCFDDPSVVRVEAGADPEGDREIVETELALSDLEQVERAREKAERRARRGDDEAAALLGVLGRLAGRLERGEPARRVGLGEGERTTVRSLNLLTMKPVVYVANVPADHALAPAPEVEAFVGSVRERDPGARVVEISARLEAEVVELPEEVRGEFLAAHGLEQSGLARLIRAGFRALGLRTFFTIGDEEVRAWTLRAGAKAPEAAGRVHSDFERGFIRAETIHYDEFVRVGSLKEARERGLIRSEGKEYVVRDGDILFFRTSA